jgi:hypothetical protein
MYIMTPWVPEAVSMKLGMYIMTPESITAAHFLPSACVSLRVFSYHCQATVRQKLLARQQTGATMEEICSPAPMRPVSQQKKGGNQFFPELLHGSVVWLRHCATNRKVAGYRPDEVNECFQFT